MEEILNREKFAECLGTSFDVQHDGDMPLSLELIEATQLPVRDEAQRSGLRQQPFSLVFRGPTGVTFSQNTYRLKHALLGSLDIFLVPIGPDDEGMCLEAVFN